MSGQSYTRYGKHSAHPYGKHAAPQSMPESAYRLGSRVMREMSRKILAGTMSIALAFSMSPTAALAANEVAQRSSGQASSASAASTTSDTSQAGDGQSGASGTASEGTTSGAATSGSTTSGSATSGEGGTGTGTGSETGSGAGTSGGSGTTSDANTSGGSGSGEDGSGSGSGTGTTGQGGNDGGNDGGDTTPDTTDPEITQGSVKWDSNDKGVNVVASGSTSTTRYYAQDEIKNAKVAFSVKDDSGMATDDAVTLSPADSDIKAEYDSTTGLVTISVNANSTATEIDLTQYTLTLKDTAENTTRQELSYILGVNKLAVDSAAPEVTENSAKWDEAGSESSDETKRNYKRTDGQDVNISVSVDVSDFESGMAADGAVSLTGGDDLRAAYADGKVTISGTVSSDKTISLASYTLTLKDAVGNSTGDSLKLSEILGVSYIVVDGTAPSVGTPTWDDVETVSSDKKTRYYNDASKMSATLEVSDSGSGLSGGSAKAELSKTDGGTSCLSLDSDGYATNGTSGTLVIKVDTKKVTGDASIDLSQYTLTLTDALGNSTGDQELSEILGVSTIVVDKTDPTASIAVGDGANGSIAPSANLTIESALYWLYGSGAAGQNIITITATDPVDANGVSSGVASVEATNIDKNDKVEFKASDGNYYLCFKSPLADGKYNISSIYITVYDNAGNKKGYTIATVPGGGQITLIEDTEAPTLELDSAGTINNQKFGGGSASVDLGSLTLKDNNLYYLLQDDSKKDTEVATVTRTNGSTDDGWQDVTIKLSDFDAVSSDSDTTKTLNLGEFLGKFSKDGDYRVTLKPVSDLSGNKSADADQVYNFRINNTAPKISVVWSGKGKDVNDAGWCTGSRTAEITIEYPEAFHNDLTTKKVSDNGEEIEVNWYEDGSRFTTTVELSAEGKHELVIEAKDEEGNSDTETCSFSIDTVFPAAEFTMTDKTALPTVAEIGLGDPEKTFWFYNVDAKEKQFAKITTKDEVDSAKGGIASGVWKVELVDDKGELVNSKYMSVSETSVLCIFPEGWEGTLDLATLPNIRVTDVAGNATTYKFATSDTSETTALPGYGTPQLVVVDADAPDVTLSTSNDINGKKFGGGSASVDLGTLRVEDDSLLYMLQAAKKDSSKDQVVAVVKTSDGTETDPDKVVWTQVREVKLSDFFGTEVKTDAETNRQYAELFLDTMTADGDYKVELRTIADLSKNESTYKAYNFRIDNTAPSVKIDWKKSPAEGEYYNYFKQFSVVATEQADWWSDSCTVKITDNGEDLINTGLNDEGEVAGPVTNEDGKSFACGDWGTSGNDHTSPYLALSEGLHKIEVTVTDEATNEGVKSSVEFYIDTTNPTAELAMDETGEGDDTGISPVIKLGTDLLEKDTWYYDSGAAGKQFAVVSATDPVSNGVASGVSNVELVDDKGNVTTSDFLKVERVTADDGSEEWSVSCYFPEGWEGTLDLATLPNIRVTDSALDEKDAAGNTETFKFADLIGDDTPQLVVVDKTPPKVDVTNEASGVVADNGYTHLKKDATHNVTLTLGDTNLDDMVKVATAGSTEYGDPVVAAVYDASGIIEYDDGSVNYGTAVRTVKVSDFAGTGTSRKYSMDIADFADGDYILRFEQPNDLANNNSADTYSFKFTVDTQAPTVDVTTNNLDGNWSSDGYCYLSSGGSSSTWTVKVEDVNLSDMVEDPAAGSRTLVTVENAATGAQVASYTLSELANGSNRWVNRSYNSSNGTTLTISPTWNGEDPRNEGSYIIKVASNGLSDLATNTCTTSDPEVRYVKDTIKPSLSLVSYGNDGNDIEDMRNIYGDAFFYQFSSTGQLFVLLRASDTQEGASGIMTIDSVSGEGIDSSRFTSNTPSSLSFASRHAEDTLCLAFNSETLVGTGAVGFWVTDNSGNSQDYTLAYDNGVITVKKGGVSSDAKPLELINDTTSPEASINFTGLSGYYDAAQSGELYISDTRLGYLLSYAASNRGTKYDAVLATVVATYNDGSTSTREIRVGDFSGSDTAAQLSQTFGEDADYHIEFTPQNMYDLSDNQCGSASATVDFTVDTIDPVISVSWDNNDVRNGKYYKAARTATIQVVEHNFDASRVTINAQGGRVGSWTSVGDTHYITVSYSSDAVCNLSVSMTDLAGRSATWQGTEFVVDLTAPTIEFTEVENEHAYNDVIAPHIVYTDEANFNSSAIEWTLTGNKTGVRTFATSTTNTSNGATVSYDDLLREVETDDIYTLHAKMTDLAGNETENEIVFSVNRFGSNYIIINAEQYEGHNGYLANAMSVVIQEINVNGAESENKGVTVTHGLSSDNLKQVSSSQTDTAGYFITGDKDSNGWASYYYNINAATFDEDGNYHVAVNSNDYAGNLNNSLSYYDPDTHEEAAAEVDFILDTTDPLIDGMSVEDTKLYDAAQEDYEISFTVTDNVGFDTVKVYIDDVEQTVTPDASGLCTVPIEAKSWTERSFSVVATDLAGRSTTATVDDFRMTTNFVELHWPVLVAAGIIAAGVAGVVIVRKRKKGTDAEQA